MLAGEAAVVRLLNHLAFLMWLVREEEKMSQMVLPILDPTEAPPGYYAVLKVSVATNELGNICRACDWRPRCSGWVHRCMPYELANGLKRNDGCSVVFKRLEGGSDVEEIAD